MTNNTTTERDMSTIESAPAIVHTAYKTGARLYLVTTYSDGTEWHRTGRISRTTGIKPAYLVMARSDSMGSSDILTGWDWGTAEWSDSEAHTEVHGIKHDGGTGYYKPGTDIRVNPGRSRYVHNPARKAA